MINLSNYRYKSHDAIIYSFKEILKPKYGGNKSKIHSDYWDSDFEEYQVIMPWLKKNDYYIEEFPNVIQNQVDLKTLGYDMIRNKVQFNSETSAGSVAWEQRRQLIDSLTIKKRNDFPAFSIQTSVKEIIREVSIGKGELHTLELDEQLVLLSNTIEYLLKEKSGFKEISSEIFYDFLDEEEVKKFRKDTHAFRHGNSEAIGERKSWSDSKKIFYVRLGIIIITNIYNKKIVL